LIADSAESVPEKRVLAVETRRRCDGLILCAPRMAEEDLRSLLDELTPVMLVNRDPGVLSTPVVAADYQAALTDLLVLLYDYGHRSLAYLAGAPHSASNTAGLPRSGPSLTTTPTSASRPSPAGSASPTVTRARTACSRRL
jgi:LacI family transcriptional regulator